MQITNKDEFNYFKKQFSNLYELNQRLKHISDVYYISHDNRLFMHSNIDFIEKYGFIKSDVSAFHGCMILPNKLFEFGKGLKKSKLKIYKFIDKYQFEDQDGVMLDINRIIQNNEIDKSREEDYIRKDLIPKLYKKFFELFPDMDFVNNPNFVNIGEEMVMKLVEPDAVTIKNGSMNYIITKNLFFDIKKEDEVSILFNVHHTDYKIYNIFKQDTSIYDLYTLTASRIPKELKNL